MVLMIQISYLKIKNDTTFYKNVGNMYFFYTCDGENLYKKWQSYFLKLEISRYNI